MARVPPNHDHKTDFLFTNLPCALTEQHTMKAYWGSGGKAPQLL